MFLCRRYDIVRGNVHTFERTLLYNGGATPSCHTNSLMHLMGYYQWCVGGLFIMVNITAKIGSGFRF